MPDGIYHGALHLSLNPVSLEDRQVHSTETAFTFLAIDTASSYIDNRPNLVAGTPESRQYQAQYLSGDDLVGQLSDILSITVPG